MYWIKLVNEFAEHPKIVGLSDAAFRTYVVAILYSSRYLTDGWIPAGNAKPRVADELIKAELWSAAPGGYRIHDYLDYQLSRAEAIELHKRLSDQGRRGAEKRWGKPKPRP